MSRAIDERLVARMLDLSAILLRGGAADLGRAIAADAAAGSFATYARVMADVRLHVLCEDPPGSTGSTSVRSFLRSVVNGGFDAEHDANPFDPDTPARAFASALRGGDTPETSPIAAALVEWIIVSMAHIEEARAAAEPDGIFVGLRPAQVNESMHRIGLGSAVAVSAAPHLGAILRPATADGRELVALCRLSGFAAALKDSVAFAVVAVRPTQAIAQLAEVDLTAADIETLAHRAAGVEGTKLIARSYEGRRFVLLVRGVEFEAALAIRRATLPPAPPSAPPEPGEGQTT